MSAGVYSVNYLTFNGKNFFKGKNSSQELICNVCPITCPKSKIYVLPLLRGRPEIFENIAKNLIEPFP